MTVYPLMPISPTNLKKYDNCSYAYKSEYILKEFKQKPNRFLERGLKVHSLLEQTVVGFNPVWPEEELYLLQKFNPLLYRINLLRDAGWYVRPEFEAVITKDGLKTDWWGKSAPVFARCKIDLLMVAPDKSQVMIFDWKTGKTRGYDETQLSLNALCLTPDFYGVPVRAFFYYTDDGTAEKFDLNIDVKTPLLTIDEIRASSLRPTLRKIGQFIYSHLNDRFPAKEGKGCRWCEVPSCPLKSYKVVQ